MRVDVWEGNLSAYLGQGNLVGRVEVHYFVNRNGDLSSLRDAEQQPSAETIAYMKEHGWGYIGRSTGNPKIVMDNGEIRYGCQVWWQPAEEETCE